MKCMNCGANWEISTDGKMLSYCPYCGSLLEMTNDTSRSIAVSTEPEHLVGLNSFTWGSVVEHVQEWLTTLRNVPTDVALQHPQCQYYPYWVVDCILTTFWRGKQQRSRVVAEGEDSKTEYYWEPDSGQFRYQYSVPVMARVGSEPWWNAALLAGSVWLERKWGGTKGWRSWWGRLWRTPRTRREHNVDVLINAVPLTDDHIPEEGLLRPNVTEESARERTRSHLESLHFEKAIRRLTTVEECSHSMSYLRTVLVHAPFWSLELVHGDNKHPVIVLGSTGEIISAVVPTS